MAAAYDDFDYPSYWEGRAYEHESEVIALKGFLDKIPKIKKLIDVGAGFGRLTPAYAFRAKKVILTDPSTSLLKQARIRLKEFKNIEFVKSKLETLGQKYRKNSFDLMLIVRVAHHLEKMDNLFKTAQKLISPGGHLILEFANKIHWKAISLNFLKGDFTFPLDIFPTDKCTKKDTLPFKNYHPEIIKKELKDHGFEIVETRSVSNVRSPFLKRNLPLPFLLTIEKLLQEPFSLTKFGPSIFVLAKKK